MRRIILCLAASAVLVLSAGPAFADGYFGCLINTTNREWQGDMTSDLDELYPFYVDAGGQTCMGLPEGNFKAKSRDGFWAKTFRVDRSESTTMGDRKVYWKLTIP